MGEAPNLYANLNEQQQFRLNKINEVKDYFVAEIRKRELISNSKSLSKNFATFDYFDKFLIALSATSGGISIASYATVIGAPVGIASANFGFTFSVTTDWLKTTRNKNNKIVLLVK